MGGSRRIDADGDHDGVPRRDAVDRGRQERTSAACTAPSSADEDHTGHARIRRDAASTCAIEVGMAEVEGTIDPIRTEMSSLRPLPSHIRSTYWHFRENSYEDGETIRTALGLGCVPEPTAT